MSDKQDTPKCPYCGAEMGVEPDAAGFFPVCKNDKCVVSMTYLTEKAALVAAQLRPVLIHAEEMRSRLEECRDYFLNETLHMDTVFILQALLDKTKGDV